MCFDQNLVETTWFGQYRRRCERIHDEYAHVTSFSGQTTCLEFSDGYISNLSNVHDVALETDHTMCGHVHIISIDVQVEGRVRHGMHESEF